MISVHQLSKSFQQPVKNPGLRGAIQHLIKGKYQEKVVVDNISMQIGPGESVAYIGKNGAGNQLQ